MGILICKYCKHQITWSDSKYAFGKLKFYGYSEDVLKPIFPSHLKCAKQKLKENKVEKTPRIKNI
jgi:hypothetical protein